MGVCICRRSDGLIRWWHPTDAPQDFNAGTEVLFAYPHGPDARGQRWDGASSLRDATAQESLDYDDLVKTREAGTRVDDKVLKAVLTYLVQRLNELRTQPTTSFPALTAQTVRDAIVTIYKGLP
jgi:hypothetical protein